MPLSIAATAQRAAFIKYYLGLPKKTGFFPPKTEKEVDKIVKSITGKSSLYELYSIPDIEKIHRAALALRTKKPGKAHGGNAEGALVAHYKNFVKAGMLSAGSPSSPSSPVIPVMPTSEKQPLNLILYGPPGTGKTYHTIEKAVDIINGVDSGHTHDDAKELFDKYKEDGRIVFTTFHQSMSYEDFIEGIKPELEGGSIGYQIEDGIFKQISNAAKENPNVKYVLIIDEINRGNVANIFGELITLIEEDKRLGNKERMTCTLPYSKKQFGVPDNLYIIGTMNTADRSVEALDTALRRRFTFEEMMPKPELLNKNVDGIDLQKFLTVINRRISLLKDREHQIGHSYFMKVSNKNELIDVIFKNIIPLLQEYFYGDYEKIQMVLGKTFITKDEDTLKEKFATTDNCDKPETVYRIAPQTDILKAIDSALKSINFESEQVTEKKPE